MRAPVNQTYSFSLGNKTDFLSRPFGFVAGLTYKISYSFHEEERFYYINGADGLEPRHHYQDFRVSEFGVLGGALLNASYKLTPNQKLALKTTFTHTAEDEVRTYAMLPNRDHNLDEICTRLRWVERTLASTDLSGDHALSLWKSKFGWRTSYSIAARNEPDTREVLYESDIGLDSFRLADESNSGSRFFSHLLDHNFETGSNWEIPFKQWSAMPAKLQLGANLAYKNRGIDSRRFRFKPQDFNDVDIYGDAEEIFTPENIRPDGYQLEEDTRPTDNYSARQTLSVGYAMVDIPLTKKLRMVGGARLENSAQRVKTYDLFNPDADPVIGDVDTTDVLPSMNLTYKLNENTNLRAGFSQTVSRPSFRELSQFEFTDIGGHAVVGNPDLKRALIQNYDVRWEWYPDIGENFSLAFFYKHFTDPIEMTLLNATEMTTSWQNAKTAYNYRGEFEVRKGLRGLSTRLANFSLTGNVAIIRSRVELLSGGMETTKERPLQGQSPYVVNFMLAHDRPQTGSDVSLSYNVFGRRIVEVGIAGTPDIYEEPFQKLDLVASQKLWKRVRAKLTFDNVLDPDVRFTQGDEIQRIYRKGRSTSLQISYSL